MTEPNTSTVRRHASEQPAVQVLVVEEDTLVRHGLAALLAGHDDLAICDAVSDPETALRRAKRVRPGLVIVDLALTTGCALQLVRNLRAAVPGIEVVVLSPHQAPIHVSRALRAGVRGYVWTADPAETMIDALRQAAEGKVYLSPHIADRFWRRKADRRRAPAARRVESLSDREMEIFELYGQGWKTRDIARHLHLSPKTIGTHRQRIKDKLRLRSMNQLVSVASRFLGQPEAALAATSADGAAD